MNEFERYGIRADAEICLKVKKYCSLLEYWNSRFDLTSVAPELYMEKHILDSVLPMQIPGALPDAGKAIDVGSGAGLPGLMLALFLPRVEWTLMDAQRKRCNFLNLCVEELAVRNVRVVQMRAEEAGRSPDYREKYDFAAARAVSRLSVLTEYMLPLLKPQGRMLCWKGPSYTEELGAGAGAAQILGGKETAVYKVPYLNDRYLIRYDKTEPTAEKYPRRNGIPNKHPLAEE